MKSNQKYHWDKIVVDHVIILFWQTQVIETQVLPGFKYQGEMVVLSYWKANAFSFRGIIIIELIEIVFKRIVVSYLCEQDLNL